MDGTIWHPIFQDFEMLLQTLAADSDGDGSEELCASVIVRFLDLCGAVRKQSMNHNTQGLSDIVSQMSYYMTPLNSVVCYCIFFKMMSPNELSHV